MASARGRFVSSNGSDSNSGTIAQPWRRIGTSIGRLSAGDTLYVRKGQYFEVPVASVSGTASAPIVVRSYPGENVIVDSGFPELQTPGNSEWEVVNAAIGEYRTKRSYSGGSLYGYVVPALPYENGRVALVPYVKADFFRNTSDQYDTSGFYVGPGSFPDPDGRIHVRLAKTADLRAFEARYGTVFAGELPRPGDYAVMVSRSTRTLRVTGSYLTFSGITFNVAKNTIELGAGSHHLRFENITAWAGDRAIEAAELGVHHVTVTQSRLYGDQPYWVFWSDMKDAPYPADKLRATTIDLGGGAHDWEITYCHVRGSGQDLLGTKDAVYNLKIHHNRFENAGDDALELEGSLGRTEVYENYFLNCLVTVASGQDSPGFLGPLFVYRNVMAGLRTPPVNRKAGINTWNGGGRYGYEYVMKQNGSDNSTKDAHVYHNTMVLLNHGGKGMNLTAQFPQGSRVANNLLVMINGSVHGAYVLASNQVVDGNLYWKMNTVDAARLVWSYDNVPALYAATRLEQHGLGSVNKRGTDPRFSNLPIAVVDRSRTVWAITPSSERPSMTSFFLSASSPARGAGIVIPPHLILGTLPDSRASRDIGAIPFGTPTSEFDRFPFNPTGAGGLVDVPGAPRVNDASVALTMRVIPNPMSGRGRLSFTLATAGPVHLELLDAQGRRVRTLVDTPWLLPGAHTVELETRRGAAPLAAGVYFYRLRSEAQSIGGRVIVVD